MGKNLFGYIYPKDSRYSITSGSEKSTLKRAWGGDVICPPLTDYACMALISVLREFAWGHMTLSAPALHRFSVDNYFLKRRALVTTRRELTDIASAP